MIVTVSGLVNSKLNVFVVAPSAPRTFVARFTGKTTRTVFIDFRRVLLMISTVGFPECTVSFRRCFTIDEFTQMYQVSYFSPSLTGVVSHSRQFIETYFTYSARRHAPISKLPLQLHFRLISEVPIKPPLSSKTCWSIFRRWLSPKTSSSKLHYT